MRDDPAFPRVHVRPERGWLGGPTGLIAWRGRHHVFFQHDPDSTSGAAPGWGHAVSDDLCEWKLEAPALEATGAPGRGAGLVVDDSGVPTLVHTAAENGTTVLRLATSSDDDLVHWDEESPRTLEAPGQEWGELRDPYVFSYDGRRYALLGTGGKAGGAPAVLIYGCDDLRQWTFLGTFVEGDDPVAEHHAPGDVWERPQLACVHDRWILVLSLSTDDALTHAAYLVGDLVPAPDGKEGLVFHPQSGGRVDHGSAFYAPAVLVEEDRVLLWGWAWEDRDHELVADAGWAGVLTWPRVLDVHPDGRLLMSPAPEVNAMRGPRTRFRLAAGESVPLPSGPCDAELMVRTVEAGPVTLRIGDVTGHLVMVVATEATGLLGIRVVIDGSLVEVHVGGGQTFTERRYPVPEGSWQLSVHGGDGLTVDATVHRLALPGS